MDNDLVQLTGQSPTFLLFAVLILGCAGVAVMLGMAGLLLWRRVGR